MIWVPEILKSIFTLEMDFITFAGGACLPAFHICVGANDQLLTADWYKEHGMLLPMFFRVYKLAISMFS